VALAALILLLGGCGGGGASSSREAASAQVRARDFRISAPKQLPAGEVDLAFQNKGPNDHELLVIRRDGEEGEAELPARRSGLTIDEEALGSAVVGALEPGEKGVRHLRVKLRPGHYELICNMAGHYYSGMEAEVTVQ
jgi:uncharacterized cupredoxin-like copper-binding protein